MFWLKNKLFICVVFSYIVYKKDLYILAFAVF